MLSKEPKEPKEPAAITKAPCLDAEPPQGGHGLTILVGELFGEHLQKTKLRPQGTHDAEAVVFSLFLNSAPSAS
jgi:hypothetical protein